MDGDENQDTELTNVQRRAFMGILSALGVTGLAGCGGDGDSTDTPTATATGTATDTETTTTESPTATTEPPTTTTEPPTATTEPPTTTTEPGNGNGDVSADGALSYSRPGDANVVFGAGVDGLAGLSETPPDLTETDVSTWQLVNDGAAFQVEPGTGAVWTRDGIGDSHLHIEFSPPDDGGGSGQGKGNSGIFLANAYEMQVLDNWENSTYGDGYAGALYSQDPPLVDPARPPTEWQAYDIIYRAPRFVEEDNSEVVSPGTVTVFLNGVCVLPHINIFGPNFGGVSPYEYHPEEVAVRLQDHNHEVQYRNIWYTESPPPSATNGVSQFRAQWEEFDPSVSTNGFMLSEYRVDFPENHTGGNNEYAPPTVDADGDVGDPPADGNLATVPGDATVLVGQDTGLGAWESDGGGSTGWSEGEGYISSASGAGNIVSTETFADAQIHAEFQIPADASDATSGILLGNRYRINISGSGSGKQATGAYLGQAAPLRDASKGAGEWQAFDIVWQGPRFEGGAILNRPGRVTVLLNGQVVQQRLYLDGPNAGGSVGNYGPHDPAQPIGLVEAGSTVHFKNVWARGLYPSEGGR